MLHEARTTPAAFFKIIYDSDLLLKKTKSK